MVSEFGDYLLHISSENLSASTAVHRPFTENQFFGLPRLWAPSLVCCHIELCVVLIYIPYNWAEFDAKIVARGAVRLLVILFQLYRSS